MSMREGAASEAGLNCPGWVEVKLWKAEGFRKLCRKCTSLLPLGPEKIDFFKECIIVEKFRFDLGELSFAW